MRYTLLTLSIKKSNQKPESVQTVVSPRDSFYLDPYRPPRIPSISSSGSSCVSLEVRVPRAPFKFPCVPPEVLLLIFEEACLVLLTKGDHVFPDYAFTYCFHYAELPSGPRIERSYITLKNLMQVCSQWRHQLASARLTDGAAAGAPGCLGDTASRRGRQTHNTRRA